MRISHDKIVALIDQFDVETDEEKKVEILRQLRQVLGEERTRLKGDGAKPSEEPGTA